MERNLLKKSYGFVLLCSLSLLMVSISSCQESKLKAMIAIVNLQCPIDMGEPGTISSIIYDGENVVYTLSMNENITTISILKDNPESIKESIKIMVRNPAKDVKEMLKLVIECNVGLKLKFVGKDSGEEAVCELTPEELKEVFKAESDPLQSEHAKLEAQVNMMSLQFPKQVNKEIEVEKIELNEKSVVYICKINEDMCPVSRIEAKAHEVQKELVANWTMQSQSDQATWEFLKNCINNNKSITYKYIGTESGNHYDVIITVPELKKMIIKE